MRKVISLFIAGMIAIAPLGLKSAFADTSYETNSIVHIIVDGKEVQFQDAKPENINGHIMVPIRFIANALHAQTIVGGASSNYFIIRNGSNNIIIYWNSKNAYVNGKQVILDSPAYIKQDRTYVPLRFISEAFGGMIDYNSTQNTVYIATFDPNNLQLYPIVKVDTGDTFVVKMDGNNQPVRLIGIDTPEMKTQTNLGMAGSFDAWNHLNSLLNNQQVYLEFDVQQTDIYGRVLAYAYLKDGTFVNADMVKSGYARIETMTPNNRDDGLLETLLQEAQANHVGIWNLSRDPWNGNDITDWKSSGTEYAYVSTPKSSYVIPNVKISGLNLKGQYIQIVNNDSKDVDMTNWKLVSSSSNQTYQFPAGYSLKSGESVFIMSGNLASDNPPAQLLWTKNNIWNESGDTANLYDSKGNLVSSYHQ